MPIATAVTNDQIMVVIGWVAIALRSILTNALPPDTGPNTTVLMRCRTRREVRATRRMLPWTPQLFSSFSLAILSKAQSVS